jgi:hypothetical protein
MITIDVDTDIVMDIEEDTEDPILLSAILGDVPEKRAVAPKRFGVTDLWAIRRNKRTFGSYGRVAN